LTEEERDKVLIDIKATDMTLGQVMHMIEDYRKNSAYQGYEIFLDGDRHAIIARRKE